MSNAAADTLARTDGPTPGPDVDRLPWFSPGCGGCALAAFAFLVVIVAIVSLTIFLAQRHEFYGR